MTTVTIDQDAVRELDLYADNTYELYNQFKSIIANLQRKIKKGTYSPTLAPRLWQYWYDEAARRYCREFGCNLRDTFPVAIRRAAAEERAKDEYQAILNGEYSA